MDECKKEFEKWAKGYCEEDEEPWLPLDMENDGVCYDDNRTFSAWAAWEAAWNHRNKHTEPLAKIANLANPTQNWGNSAIVDPEYALAQIAENKRLRDVVDDIQTKAPDTTDPKAQRAYNAKLKEEIDQLPTKT